MVGVGHKPPRKRATTHKRTSRHIPRTAVLCMSVDTSGDIVRTSPPWRKRLGCVSGSWVTRSGRTADVVSGGRHGGSKEGARTRSQDGGDIKEHINGWWVVCMRV